MTVFKLQKEYIYKIGTIAVCCALLVMLNMNFDKFAVIVSGSARQIPIYRVARNDNKASISFDAAWGNEDTEQLIEILARYNVKATFFVVGEWVDKYPESVKALHDAGHEIMSHSDTHPHMPQLSRDNMRKEIRTTAEKIEKVTGTSPNLFRPPYGDYSNALIEVLKEEGALCIQWDVDSLDWKDLSANQIAERVSGKIRPGSIVLFHNAAKNTPQALTMILEQIKAKGIDLVKISELIYYENYKIDHTGEQSNVSPAAASINQTEEQETIADDTIEGDDEQTAARGKRMSSTSYAPPKRILNTSSPFMYSEQE